VKLVKFMPFNPWAARQYAGRIVSNLNDPNISC
jgi:hypothetical protein